MALVQRPRAARRARPGHRVDEPARGPRRVRHGRRRPGRRPVGADAAQAFAQRRKGRGPLDRVLRRLLGLERRCSSTPRAGRSSAASSTGRHGRLQPGLGWPGDAAAHRGAHRPGALGGAGARPPGHPRLSRRDAWPVPLRRSPQVRSAVRPGLTGVASSRCSSPAAAEPTRWRWPRRSPSRRRGAGVPAGAVTVDHGLQPGSAERAERHRRAARATSGSHPVLVVRGGRRRRRRAGGRGPRRPLRGPGRGGRRAGRPRRARPHPRRPGRDRAARPRPRLRARARWPAWSSSGGRRRDWWRPLLGVRRATTRAACAAQDLPVWDDPWNDDPAYTRVRLRTEVLPLLEDVLGGGVAPALARTAALLREDLDALDALAAGRPRRAERRRRPARSPSSPACPRRCAGGCCAAGCAPPACPTCRRCTWPPSTRSLVRWHGQGRVDLPGGAGVVRASGRLVLPAARDARAAARCPHPRTARSPPRERAVRRSSAGRSGPDHGYGPDIDHVLLTEEQIQAKIARAGRPDRRRLRRAEVLLVGVLKGAVMFMADFARALQLPTQMEFMAVSSYGSATSSSGVVRILKDLDRDITDKHVLVVEDIIDSGPDAVLAAEEPRRPRAGVGRGLRAAAQARRGQGRGAGEVHRLRHPERVRRRLRPGLRRALPRPALHRAAQARGLRRDGDPGAARSSCGVHSPACAQRIAPGAPVYRRSDDAAPSAGVPARVAGGVPGRSGGSTGRPAPPAPGIVYGT